MEEHHGAGSPMPSSISSSHSGEIEKVILVDMVANTCVQGTARFDMELGCQVTLI